MSTYRSIKSTFVTDNFIGIIHSSHGLDGINPYPWVFSPLEFFPPWVPPPLFFHILEPAAGEFFLVGVLCNFMRNLEFSPPLSFPPLFFHILQQEGGLKDMGWWHTFWHLRTDLCTIIIIPVNIASTGRQNSSVGNKTKPTGSHTIHQYQVRYIIILTMSCTWHCSTMVQVM